MFTYSTRTTKSVWRDGIPAFFEVAFQLAPACGLLFLTIAGLFPQRVSAEETPNLGAEFKAIPDTIFPNHSAIIDVTKPPYNAKGDGLTDDSDAIQRALQDVMGLRKVVYLPAGTYLISKTINWSKKNSAGNDAWGFNYLQGQNALKTVLKLRDGTFPDAKNPQSMMWCGGFGSADWFHNYIQDITFDIGKDNPGAIGLQFYSNNTGAVRNCRIVDESGNGFVGLDLGHRDMNGPLLVRNCEIFGFRRGVSTSRSVNSQTFEHLTLRGQSQFGFENEGQSAAWSAKTGFLPSKLMEHCV
jgi:hypothetical protein